MKRVIFVGPTISVKEAGAILDAEYLPPIKQGDIISAIFEFQPDVIGIIDGADHHVPSVWHKEIIFALQNGIAVYGSSSIGALRAVETERFGMVGIGEVYNQFRSGRLNDDDEVMFLYKKNREEYTRLSEPMVNIRATLESALRQGVIDPEIYDCMIRISKSMFYKDRALKLIFDKSVDEGIEETAVKRLEEFTVSQYVDIQKKDAVELLNAIKDMPVSKESGKNNRIVDELDSMILHVLKYRDREISRNGINAPIYSIGDYIALNHPETDGIMERAKNRLLTKYLADMLHVEVAPKETDEESDRFRKRHGLRSDAEFNKWMLANDLILEEFNSLMTEKARMRKVHKWLKTRLSFRRFTKIFLDELRLDNQYCKWVEKAFSAEKICSDRQDMLENLYQNEDLDKLISEHIKADRQNWHADFLQTVKDAGFTPKSLKYELIKTKLARDHYLKIMEELAPE